MFLIYALVVFFIPVSAQAVDVAPRISDREIIESLASLKQGQADSERSIDKRFDAVDKRFDAVDKRFDDLNRNIDKRFDSVNQRITDLQTTILGFSGAMFTLIIAIFGYIAWDRRTVMKPVQERLDKHEMLFHKELDITHGAGSVLTRLVKALKELAKTDPKLAKVLRSFSLL
jgi:predicted PurR-regulated permease PerM